LQERGQVDPICGEGVLLLLLLLLKRSQQQRLRPTKRRRRRRRRPARRLVSLRRRRIWHTSSFPRPLHRLLRRLLPLTLPLRELLLLLLLLLLRLPLQMVRQPPCLRTDFSIFSGQTPYALGLWVLLRSLPRGRHWGASAAGARRATTAAGGRRGGTPALVLRWRPRGQRLLVLLRSLPRGRHWGASAAWGPTTGCRRWAGYRGAAIRLPLWLLGLRRRGPGAVFPPSLCISMFHSLKQRVKGLGVIRKHVGTHCGEVGGGLSKSGGPHAHHVQGQHPQSHTPNCAAVTLTLFTPLDGIHLTKDLGVAKCSQHESDHDHQHIS
jgi:hypothetical protein